MFAILIKALMDIKVINLLQFIVQSIETKLMIDTIYFNRYIYTYNKNLNIVFDSFVFYFLSIYSIL